jgi:hypothetical protein
MIRLCFLLHVFMWLHWRHAIHDGDAALQRQVTEPLSPSQGWLGHAQAVMPPSGCACPPVQQSRPVELYPAPRWTALRPEFHWNQMLGAEEGVDQRKRDVGDLCW